MMGRSLVCLIKSTDLKRSLAQGHITVRVSVSTAKQWNRKVAQEEFEEEVKAGKGQGPGVSLAFVTQRLSEATTYRAKRKSSKEVLGEGIVESDVRTPLFGVNQQMHHSQN